FQVTARSLEKARRHQDYRLVLAQICPQLVRCLRDVILRRADTSCPTHSNERPPSRPSSTRRDLARRRVGAAHSACHRRTGGRANGRRSAARARGRRVRQRRSDPIRTAKARLCRRLPACARAASHPLRTERGRPVTLARDEAVAAGIGINGLPILALRPDLDRYYYGSVIGGPGPLVGAAQNSQTLADAILKKLIIEIAANDR